MEDKKFLPSAIEYQMLEDHIMGTNLDLIPYYPSYPPLEKYKPWWEPFNPNIEPYVDSTGTSDTIKLKPCSTDCSDCSKCLYEKNEKS